MIVNTDINYEKPYFKQISKEAISFLKSALTKPVNERASAQELLAHPWLKNKTQLQQTLNEEQHKDLINNLLTFSKADKFQKTVVSLLTGLRAEKSDLKMLQMAFEAMDTNKDGTLTRDEFIKAASQLQEWRFKDKGEEVKWNEVFQKIDLDGDGRLDFHEFIAGAVEHSKIMTKQNLQYIFRLFDANNDGVIELDEFKNTLPTHHRKTIKEDLGASKGAKRLSTDSSGSTYIEKLEMQQEADDKKWKEIISHIDKNGDGRVSFEEFEQACERFITSDMPQTSVMSK